MKRRPFKSILHVPYGCGWTAICEENKAWHLAPKATEWTQLPELPPIEEPANAGLLTREQYAKEHDRLYGTDMAKLPAGFFDPSLGQPWPEDQASDRPAVNPEPIPCQGLGRQDLPIRDWYNLAAMVDRAERVLLYSIPNPSIDVGYVLRSLIGEIRNELGLPKPSETAK